MIKQEKNIAAMVEKAMMSKMAEIEVRHEQEKKEERKRMERIELDLKEKIKLTEKRREDY